MGRLSHAWVAVKPITSGCSIYQKEVKQVAESLCGARYENGTNSTSSQNKPRLFEVWIPHNCVNLNHSLQLSHSKRQNLLKCWGLTVAFYDLISSLFVCFLTSNVYCQVRQSCRTVVDWPVPTVVCGIFGLINTDSTSARWDEWPTHPCDLSASPPLVPCNVLLSRTL